MFQSGNVTVMVSDFERAVRFYTETLGLELRFRSGDEWAEVTTQGLTVGLHKAGTQGPRPGAEGALSIGLQVAEIAAAMERLQERGIRFGQVVEDGPVKLAFLGDPDGNPLYLCQTSAP
ncbi:MAG: VOC family protein [Planctomycetota bacterium]|jgi:catechol 2,3-dioxygenase-like lactoylglutathione lyase family enzyme